MTFKKLRKSIKDINNILANNNSYFKIIMRDCNAKVGKHHLGDDEVVGPSGFGERNGRGTRLVQLAMANDMHLSNTYFKKKSSRK